MSSPTEIEIKFDAGQLKRDFLPVLVQDHPVSLQYWTLRWMDKLNKEVEHRLTYVSHLLQRDVPYFAVTYTTVLMIVCRAKVANGNYLHVPAAVLKMLEHALPAHSEGCTSVTRAKYSLQLS